MSSAGQQLTAGRIPGERIATDEEISDSSSFTTTEVVLQSVTAPLVSGRTYALWWIGRFGSDTSGDIILARIRQDNISGVLEAFGHFEIATASALGGRQDQLYGEYTATSTGNKTFVFTGDNLGSGNARLDAEGGGPSWLFVDYIRG